METLALVVWPVGWPLVCNLEDLVEALRARLNIDIESDSDSPDRIVRIVIWLAVGISILLKP